MPGKNGVRVIEVLKSGKKMETVSCHDFGMLDESFRPQAIVYAANYGPKGKPHPTYTVDGVEKIVPVVVDQCKARPGDHFVTSRQARDQAAAVIATERAGRVVRLSRSLRASRPWLSPSRGAYIGHGHPSDHLSQSALRHLAPDTGLLSDAGIDLTVIEYLKTPPTAEELRRLYAKAGLSPRDGLRKTEAGADACCRPRMISSWPPWWPSRS